MKYTIKEIKKELDSYLNDKEYLEEKKQDIEELREQATKMTSVISDMPKGTNPVNDRLAEYVAKMVEMMEESFQIIISMEKKKAKIENIIDRIEQPYKNILYFKYIKGVELKEVTTYLDKDYDYKWLCVLHGRALEAYRKIREKENG